MKQIQLLFVAMLLVFSCKAQQHIIDIDSYEDYDNTPNYYLKDINKKLNKFEGTWVWQSGNTKLTFTLKKEIKYQTSQDSKFIDLLVGEYQYIENGTEKANTLPNLDIPKVKGYDHKINGRLLLEKDFRPKCDSCSVEERRIKLRIHHPTATDVHGYLVLRWVNINGIEKLEAYIFRRRGILLVDPNRTEPTAIDIPLGNYVLTKQ